MNAMKWSLDFILFAIEDALQGVEATGDVAPKTVTMYFLSVFESDICFFYNILAVLAANEQSLSCHLRTFSVIVFDLFSNVGFIGKRSLQLIATNFF